MISNISQDFVETLIGTVPDQYLQGIKEKLVCFLIDYDIHKKCTDIVKYESVIPQEVAKYLAVQKVSGRSDKTIAAYQLHLSNFFSAVGKGVKDITQDDIILYLATYKSKRKVSDSSLDLYRIILNSFFGWCNDEEIIPKNPCKRVKPIKYWKEKETPLNDYQIESIRQACKNQRDLAIIDFLLSTGCRVSELISVKCADVDFDESRLDIVGKGNKKRTVYLNGRAIHSIKAYIEQMETKPIYLFSSLRKPHNKLTKDAVEKSIGIIGTSVGLPNLHPHLFRKTMATNALKRGMDVTVIQRILGHENIETTMRYINISQEDIANAHKKYVA